MANTKTMDGKRYIQWGGASGRDVYCEVGPVAVQLEKLEQNIHRCFHHRTLYNRLKTLKDTTSIFVSQAHSKHTDRRLCRMNIPGSQVDYFLKEGAAFITRLVLQDSDYRYDASLMRAPGPYRMEKDSRTKEWAPKRREDRVRTLHASVNGEVEDLREVLQFMPAMIKQAGGEHEVTGKGKRRGFTHLYMPGKNSKEYGWRDMVSTVPVRGSDEFVAARQSLVEQTAACIELAARAKEEVKWTIQGSGSDIFCDAAEYVIQHHPDLSLERQSAHFFNPHTDPMRIKRVIGGAGGEEAYTSAFKSPGNIAAMAKGHRQYTQDKIAKTKKDAPGTSQMATNQEGKRLDRVVDSYKSMALTIASAVTGASLASRPEAVLDVYLTGLQNAPVATIGGSVLAAAGLHTLVTHTSPQMLALGRLGLAAIKGDRRLDQLTEYIPFKAYDQFKNLKLGCAI